uniref:Uncharacterized protein n=1 Tax=Cacopsylla melanoneura TaxID=428564 RepID=A0A8D8WN52_9HEMI
MIQDMGPSMRKNKIMNRVPFPTNNPLLILDPMLTRVPTTTFPMRHSMQVSMYKIMLPLQMYIQLNFHRTRDSGQTNLLTKQCKVKGQTLWHIQIKVYIQNLLVTNL